jgi:hypothetical protein
VNKLEKSVNTVLVLANLGLTKEKADTLTVVTVLRLQSAFKNKKQAQPRMIVELLDAKFKDLLSQDIGVELLLCNTTITCLLTQLAEQWSLGPVFNDLFSSDDDRCEIFLKPAQNYTKLGVSTPFLQIQTMARIYGEIAIGWVSSIDGVHINIDFNQKITLKAGDEIIVVANDGFIKAPS